MAKNAIAQINRTTDGFNVGHTITLPNGTVLARTVNRDPYRRSLAAGVSNAIEGSMAFDYRYDYDLLGRAISRNDDAFDYNTRSEVTSATIQPSHTNHYEYDNIGNNQWTTVNGATNAYAANNLNQYTSILCAPAPLREPSYDLDGNLLTNGVWAFTWDGENRLKAVYSNSVCVVSNAYDHAHRRVLKVTPTTTCTYLYDGWNLIQETIQNQQSTITNSFVWGKDLSGTLQGAGGVGGLLAISIGGAWYFPCYDNNGNVTAYADESGNLVAEYIYAAFGRTIAPSGSMADDFSFRFSTKYYDTETGLYFYGYRFYAPDLMRWLSRDLIGEEGGLNLYGALLNSPVNYVDAYGNRITVTFANEGNETQAVIVHATIQIVDCLTPPSGAEKDAFKRKIEAVWAALAYYRESVPARVSSNVIRNESITRKRKIRTTVDIKYITSDSKKDPTRHTFYFLGKQGTDIDRSHAEIGGNESWIYKEDHNQPRTLAHEFGHWLGLIDEYGDLIVDGKIKSVGDPDNIMSAGEDVWASQMLRIWNQYQAGKLNQGIKGK